MDSDMLLKLYEQREKLKMMLNTVKESRIKHKEEGGLAGNIASLIDHSTIMCLETQIETLDIILKTKE